MTTIMTGAGGKLAYWDARPPMRGQRAFAMKGRFMRPLERSFARLSAFAANGNHAPTDFDAAVTCDAGLDLLSQIARPPEPLAPRKTRRAAPPPL